MPSKSLIRPYIKSRQVDILKCLRFLEFLDAVQINYGFIG